MAYRDYNEIGKLNYVRSLVKDKRYGEALQVLEELDTPNARRMHAKLVEKINLADTEFTDEVDYAVKAITVKHNRYIHIRVLSYLVRFIALVWLVFAVFLWQGQARPILGMTGDNIVSQTDVAILTVGQAFFIYVFGSVIDMLADLATNISYQTAIVKRQK